jgi:hypothetical protein
VADDAFNAYETMKKRENKYGESGTKTDVIYTRKKNT